MLIRREDGSEVEMCLSNLLDQSLFERGQLYIGETYFSKPGAVKIKGYDHTRYVIAKLMGYSIVNASSRGEHLALMTRKPWDWIMFFSDSETGECWFLDRLPK